MSTLKKFNVLPDAAAGASVASAASTWGYGSYVTIASGGFPLGAFVTAVIIQPEVVTSISLDTTYMGIIELYYDASDTLFAQLPFTWRADTLVAHTKPITITLPEPVRVQGNVQIRARVADSNAAALTHTGIKILYYENTAPTVALNSPADASSGSDTTPDLGFTGTDAEGEDVRYEIEVSDKPLTTLYDDFDDNSINTSLWTASGDAAQVIEQNGRMEITHNNTIQYNTIRRDDFFNVVDGEILVQLVDAGNQAITSHLAIFGFFDDVDAIWFSVSGGFISAYKKIAGVQTQIGSFITYSSTDHQWLRLRESGGVTYWDTSPDSLTWTNLWSTANVISMYIVQPYLQSGAYAAEASGSYAYFDNFNISTRHFFKISGTDPGFSGTPDNTDPFASGQAVTYTVQAGDTLPDGTYYWRVRAIDPTGSNTYGAWSATRSFTLAAVGGYTLVADTATFTLTGFATGLSRALVLTADTGSFVLTLVAAVISKAYTLAAETGTFTIATFDMVFLRGYQVTCDTGAFTLAGVATGVYFNRAIIASSASFALSSFDVNLARGFIFDLATGSFTATGVDAAFSRTYALAAETATFSITGVSADITRAYSLTAETGTFSMTAYAVAFPRASVMLLSTGVFTATGQNTDLLRSYELHLTTSAFNLNGIDALVAHNRVLDVSVGSFAVSTVDATFSRSYVLVASPAAFTMSGQDVGIIKNFTITADAAAFTVTVVDVVLAKGIIMAAETGSYTLSSAAITFPRTYAINATATPFTVTTIAAALNRAYVLPLSTGSFALSGIEVGVLIGHAITAESQSYTIGGIDIALLRSFNLDAEAAQFDLTGSDANIQATGSFTLDTGVFTLTGSDVGITKHYVLQAEAATFTLTGSDATFGKVFILIAEAATFIATGTAVTFIKHAILDAEPASFVSYDTTANLTIARNIDTDTGVFVLTGYDVGTGFGLPFMLETGVFTLSSSPTELLVTRADLVNPYCPRVSLVSPGTSPFTEASSLITTADRPYSVRPGSATRPHNQC